ncbi:MAG: hypothetical protein ACLTML_21070 [Blautia faecis]
MPTVVWFIQEKNSNDQALLADTLYYYQEVEAPQGYQKDSTKYYFGIREMLRTVKD